MSPRIIAVEGLDAAGKGTQAQLLTQHFQKEGATVASWSFPRYESFFGRRVGALLAGTESVTAASLDPRSMALWFALDRWDAVQHGLPAADVVILNRWTLSNAVYQGARESDPDTANEVFDWVLDLEYGTLGLPQPHTTILLDISVEVSMHRSAQRAGETGDKPDVYESRSELLIASRRLYARAASQGHGTLINVDHHSIDEVAQLIRAHI